MFIYLHSIGPNFYVKLPSYFFINNNSNFKNNRKLTFYTKKPDRVLFNRKVFSEKRGRVIKAKG